MNCGGEWTTPISGMLHPVKVSGFLSPTAPSWDPSLMLVMGGALALCAPGFYLIQKQQKMPACSLTYNIPNNKTIDKKLVAGGVLFGAGWGLGGICPGPAIVVRGGARGSHTDESAFRCPCFFFLSYAVFLLDLPSPTPSQITPSLPSCARHGIHT